jgi:hypothetical protein
MLTYTTGTNVPYLSRLYYVVQGAHDLLHWDVAIQPVDLEEVDIGAKSFDAGIDGVKNVFPAKTDSIDHGAIIDRAFLQWKLSPVMTDTEIAFSQQRDVLARYVVYFQRLTDNALTVSLRVKIGLEDYQLG